MAGEPPTPPSRMRALGEFFGHIWKGVKTNPAAPPRQPAPEQSTRESRRTVEEEERETSRGKVLIRRTIIEEVELPRDDGGSSKS